MWLTLAKGARLNFAYRVRNETGGLLLEAETSHACATLEEKPRRIPEDLGTLLATYLHPSEGPPELVTPTAS